MEPIFRDLEKLGCDILVKNGNGKMVLCLAGPEVKKADIAKIKRISQVAKVTQEDALLWEDPANFIELWQYMARRDGGKSHVTEKQKVAK
jgi:hypothetical protein